MTIESASFVTVKQAAAALGVAKEAIEQRLEAGRLRGKKEKVLSRDMWFVYRSEIDALLSQKEERLFADEERAEQTDFSPRLLVQPVAEETDMPTMQEQFQLSLRLMSEEFSRCMQSSLAHIQDLRDQLKTSESKLLLLTDMEQRAAEDRQLIDDKDAALAAAHERITALNAQVEKLSRPWWKKILGT
jgi:hypothetical protein